MTSSVFDNNKPQTSRYRFQYDLETKSGRIYHVFERQTPGYYKHLFCFKSKHKTYNRLVKQWEELAKSQKTYDEQCRLN